MIRILQGFMLQESLMRVPYTNIQEYMRQGLRPNSPALGYIPRSETDATISIPHPLAWGDDWYKSILAMPPHSWVESCGLKLTRI